MTACVNRKHTKKVAAVVTASLVGALSLGAAPVAAMAATGTGIDLQAVDWNTDAKVTKATDGKGGTVSNPTEATFTLGSGKYLVPTEVANSMVTTPIDDTFSVGYTYVAGWDAAPQKSSDGTSYVGLGVGGQYRTADGDVFTVSAQNQALTPEQAESYFGGSLTGLDGLPVQVRTSANYEVTVSKDGGSVSQVFKVKAQSTSQDIKVKGTVTYNGLNQQSTIQFVDEDGNGVSNSGVIWKNADGTPATGGIVNAGSYYAVFPNGETVAVEVQPLDLSTASVSIADLDSTLGPQVGHAYWNSDILANVQIGGTTINSTLAGQLKISSRSNPNKYASGENTVTIERGTGSASNIKGSATVSFTIYDVKVCSAVSYGRQDVKTNPLVEIYLEDGASYDESKISVKDASGNAIDASQLEITYANSNGEKVDASALAEKGFYTVTVRVKPYQDFASGKWCGGSYTFNVDVKAMSLNSNKNLAFFFDGELSGDSASVTYDGTDQLSRLETVVKNAAGDTMEEGTDYTLEITKDGKEVESATDAGTYVVTVKPVSFDFESGANNTFTLTVNKVDAKRLVAATDDMMFTALDNGYIPTAGDDDNNWWTPQVANQFFVAYTGSAIELPGVKYEVANSDGTFTYPELSSDLFNVVSIKKVGKTVKEVKDEGTYTVKIALTDEAAANYQLSEDEYTVTVKSYGHFVDVDSAKWYSVPVEKAYELGYVHGISNTNLFAPEADITRADAVCILFNMAGGDSLHGDDEFSFSEDKGYDTGFNDVDGHAYFAKALAWAHASGVANGSNGDFRPYDKITREEFASLLANFAKNKGDFTAADEGALDGMSDANTVSDWATDNVAWAVENGVMGNGGFVAGQSNITRAEVAAMAVNYQPEAL